MVKLYRKLLQGNGILVRVMRYKEAETTDARSPGQRPRHAQVSKTRHERIHHKRTKSVSVSHATTPHRSGDLLNDCDVTDDLLLSDATDDLLLSDVIVDLLVASSVEVAERLDTAYKKENIFINYLSVFVYFVNPFKINQTRILFNILRVASKQSSFFHLHCYINFIRDSIVYI